MEHIVIFSLTCIVIVHAVSEGRDDCISIRNIPHAPVADFTWTFFGKAALDVDHKLEMNVTLSPGFERAYITFDHDDKYRTTSLVLEFYPPNNALLSTRKDNQNRQEERGKHPIKGGQTFLMEVYVLELGYAWGTYAYVIYLDKNFYCIFPERKDGLQIVLANYVSVMMEAHVDSVKICNAKFEWQRKLSFSKMYNDKPKNNTSRNDCIHVSNIGHKPVAGYKWAFFGKAGLDVSHKLIINATLDPNYNSAYFTFDLDEDHKNVAMQLNFNSDGTLTAYDRGDYVFHLIETGKHLLKAGQNFIMEVTVIELGMNFNSYAYEVHIDGKFFCIFPERKGGLEITHANYVSVIKDAAAHSIILCDV